MFSPDDFLGPTEKDNGGQFEKAMDESKKHLEDIKDAVEKSSDLLKDILKEDMDAFKEVVEELKKQGKGSKKKGKGGSKDSSDFSSQFVSKLEKYMAKKGASNDKVAAELEKVAAGLSKSISGGSPKKMNLQKEGMIYGQSVGNSIGQALQNTVGSVLTGMLGGASAFQLITNGMFEQEMQFAMGMNLIAYQTEGITEQAGKMRDAFRQTSDIVATTGYDVTTFQTELMAATKRGLKNAQSIVKTGLNLGKMMGLNEQEAVQVAEKFADWNQHLGMTKDQLADVSRGIQQTARFTGLTGQNLMEVAKNSERFLDMMRSAGSLTSQSATNMIRLQAEFKKLGIDNTMSDMSAAMSNSADLLLSAEPRMKSLMFQAAEASGVTRDLMDNTLTETAGGFKAIAAGMADVFKQYSGGIDVKDVNKMTAQAKSELNIRIKAGTGKGLDDFIRAQAGLEAAGMTFSDRMAAVDKELGAHATKEEKLTATRKKQDMIMSETFSFVDKLGAASKDAKNFDDVIGQMQKNLSPKAWEETKQNLAAAAGTFSPDLKKKVESGDNQALVEAATISAARALKKAGGNDYEGQLKKAVGSKDLTKLRTIQGKMNVEQQKLGIEQLAAMNPIEAVAQHTKKMNEAVRAFSTPALTMLMSIVGSTGLIAGYMAMAAAHGIFNLKSLKSMFDMGSNGAEMFGMGKGAKSAMDMTKLASTGGAATGAKSAMDMTKLASTGGAATGAAGGVEAAGVVGGAEAAGGGAAAAGGMGALETGGILLLVLGAIGAVAGNLWAGAEAANMFDTATEDLTMSQYYAAKGAGTLTGALDFMTFGIFHEWLGTTGSLTKSLAQLSEKFPLLSAMAVMLDASWGAMWGIMRNVWEIIAGFGEMIYLAFEPIGEIMTALMEPFASFTSKLSETGTVFEMMSDIFSTLGRWIRQGLRAIGAVVGFISLIIIKPLAGAISGLGKVFGNIFEGIWQRAQGIMQFIHGIVTFDLGKIWGGMVNAFKGLMKTILGTVYLLILGMPQIILDAIANLATWVGSWFDEIDGVIGAVLQWAVFGFKIIGKVAKGLSDTLSGIYDFVVGIVTFDWDRLSTGFTNILTSLPSMIWELAVEGFNIMKKIFWDFPIWLGGLLLDGLTAVFIDFPLWLGGLLLDGLMAVFVDFPLWLGRMVLDGLAWMVESIHATLVDFPRWICTTLIDNLAWVFGTLPKMLWDSLMDGLTSLASNDWVGPIFEPFLEIITPLYDAMTELWTAFDGLWAVIRSLFEPFAAVSGEGISFKEIIKGIATVIGWVIRVALAPLRLIFQGLAAIITNVVVPVINVLTAAFSIIVNVIRTTVAQIIAPFQWLYEVLVGHSIVPDLINGIISWFAQLPIMVFDVMSNFITGVVGYFGSLPSRVFDSMASMMPKWARKLLGISAEPTAAPSGVGQSVTTPDMSLEKAQIQAATLPKAESAPTTDMHTAVKREDASSDGKRKETATNFNDMISVNESQLDTLEQLHEDMQTLIAILSGGGGSGDSRPKTKSNTKPISSPDYNMWQFGRFNQNASTQIVTDGR